MNSVVIVIESAKAAFRMLFPKSKNSLPRARDVDSIVKPLGKIMDDLNAACIAHFDRAQAQRDEARKLEQAAVVSEAESNRAARLADKIYQFVA